MPPQRSSSAERTQRRDVAVPRGRSGACLAATMAAASLMQFSVGALAPLILLDLDLTRTRLGLLLSGYYVLAAVTSPVFGRVVERVGHRAALGLVASLAIAGNGLIALVGGQASLALGLLLAGLAVAAANPATNLALASMPPPHGALMGVKQSGFQVAAVVAGVLMPFVASAYGWRASFGVAALIAGMVLLIIGRWSPPASAGRVRRPSAVAPAPVQATGGTGVRAFAAYAFFMGIGTANVGVYLALYAHESLSIPEQRAGAVVAVVGGAAVVARIGWSVLVERARGRLGDERAVLRLIACLAAGATVVIVLAQHAGSWLVWPAALVIGLSAAAWNSVVMLALLRGHAGGRLLGRASGTVQGSFFWGLATGPPVFGVAVDRGGDYALGWCWTLLSFVAALAAAFLLRDTRPASAHHATTPPEETP